MFEKGDNTLALCRMPYLYRVIMSLLGYGRVQAEHRPAWCSSSPWTPRPSSSSGLLSNSSSKRKGLNHCHSCYHHSRRCHHHSCCQQHRHRHYCRFRHRRFHFHPCLGTHRTARQRGEVFVIICHHHRRRRLRHHHHHS
jgi:hypothetical protein